jgi:hypothetical protein
MRIRSGTIGLGRRHRIALLSRILAAGAVVVGTYNTHAEDQLRLKAEAPKDQRIVGRTTGGYYFAAQPLKEEYDKLVDRVYALKLEIVDGKISSKTAAAEIRVLQSELQRVRQLIDATKTFIATGKLSTKTEITEFELGSEKLLFINGPSKVHLIGWDQPNVKCVLDKTVIGDGDQPLDNHFSEIRLIHRQGPTEAGVGQSPEKRMADEEAFLVSPDGKKLTPEQVQARHAWMEKAFATAGYFRPFQDKPIDYLELEGLTYQQGNRQVLYEVSSRSGGDGRAGSMWQRHTILTIYVPSCNAIGLRGGLGGLDVEGVKAQLIVRGEGDRDYDSHSQVKDHDGPVTIENISLETVENIRGNVSVTVSADLGNAGTSHQAGKRTQFVELPIFYNYRNIQGDFTALLLKANLQLSEVTGRVNVTNEFGDTQFVVRTPLAATAHRVMSESGNITLQLDQNSLQSAPLLAVSECGTVHVIDKGLPLVDGNISCWPGSGLTRRTYRGFASKSDENSPFGRFERLQRMQNTFTNEQPTPGLDVISRSGTVQIESVEN